MIQRIVEIPMSEVQKPNFEWTGSSTQCCLCGKKVGANPKMIHVLTNGNIVSYDGDDIENSQGFFPVGNECAKKLVINFAF